MNRKVNFLLLSILMLSIYSCSKDSSTPAPSNSITLSGSTIDLNGLYLSGLKRVPSSVDTLAIYNTDTKNITAIGDSSTNFVIIALFAPNIKVGTYTGGGTTPLFGIVANVKKKAYITNETDKNTLTISSLSTTSVSGSYSAKMYNFDSIPVTVTGNFNTALQ